MNGVYFVRLKFIREPGEVIPNLVTKHPLKIPEGEEVILDIDNQIMEEEE